MVNYNIPPIFANKPEIQKKLREISFVQTIIYYMIDSKFRRSVNLQRWLYNTLKNTKMDEIIKEIRFNKDDSNVIKCKKALKWVNKNIRYEGDLKIWDANEKWQTPVETLEKRTGDCEDFSILLYSILSFSGVPDEQLRIVAGDVESFSDLSPTGHCYVVWLSDEDGWEYVLDACYHYELSYPMIEVYIVRKNYFYGQREWFSFTASCAYRRKQK